MVYRRNENDHPITPGEVGGNFASIEAGIPPGLVTDTKREYYYDPSNGFVGTIVDVEITRYVVYRGTDMSSGIANSIANQLGWKSGNLVDSKDITEANLKLGFGTTTRSQLDSALALFDLARSTAGDRALIVTGQSLGGGLAGLVSAVRDVSAIAIAPAPFQKQIPYEATYAALAAVGIGREAAQALADSPNAGKAGAYSEGGR